MTLGKREQMVILAVSGILSIFLLHMFVFKSNAKEYDEAFDQYVAAKGSVESLVLAEKREDVDDFSASNAELKVMIEKAREGFKIQRPEAFDLRTIEHPDYAHIVNAEDPADEATDRGVELEADRQLKYPQQIDLVMEEIRNLLEFDSRTGGQRATNAETGHTTEMSFLQLIDGQVWNVFGWNLPTELPSEAQTQLLLDILRKTGENLDILQSISDPVMLAEQRLEYEQYLLDRLQINLPALYGNDAAEVSLNAKGVYVPLIHKACYALLIEDQLDRLPDDPEKEKYTRDRILELFEIYFPLAPMVDASGAEIAPPLNEMYFIYEHLRFLNTFLEAAVQSGVADIMRVKLGDPSYLRTQWARQVIIGEVAGPTPTPVVGLLGAPGPTVPKSPFVLPPPPEETPLANGMRPGAAAGARDAISDAADANYDIGYAIPQTILFSATNRDGMKLIYDFLRENPMASLDGLKITTDQLDPESTEIFFEITLIGVPFLFALEEGWIRPEFAVPPG